MQQTLKLINQLLPPVYNLHGRNPPLHTLTVQSRCKPLRCNPLCHPTTCDCPENGYTLLERHPGLFLNATMSAKSDRSSLRNSCTNGTKINLQYNSTFSGYFMGVCISIDVCMNEHTYLRLLNS